MILLKRKQKMKSVNKYENKNYINYVKGISPKTNTRVSKPKSASNSNKKIKSNTKKEKQPNN